MSASETSLSANEPIRLSSFAQGMKEGLNRFQILGTNLDSIVVKGNDEKPVLVLQIELINEQNSEYRDILDNYYVFIDYSRKNQFYQLIKSATAALNTTELSNISELIGLCGTVMFSYYKPDEERSYPRLANWNFFAQDKNITDVMAKYGKDLASSEISDEDFEF